MRVDAPVHADSRERLIAIDLSGKRDALAITLIVAVTATFFAPALLTGRVPAPLDTLSFELPWRAYMYGARLQNHYLADVSAVFYSWKTWLAGEFSRGTWPLWSAEVGLGYPVFARPGSFGFGTLFLLLFGLPAGHNLYLFFQMCVAGICMYLFVRTLGVGVFGALVSALAFALSMPIFVQLLFEQIVGAIIWLPLALLFLEKLWQTGRLRQAAGAAVAVGLAALHGSVQAIVYVLMAIALYVILRGLLSPQGSCRIRLGLWFGLAAAATILGLGIGAISLIPSIELALLNYRKVVVAGDVGVWLATWWKKPLMAGLFAVGSVFPDLIGNQHSVDFAKVLGDLGGRAGESVSGSDLKAYIGLLPALLALIALRYKADERMKVFGAMAIVPIALAFITPLFLVLYSRVTVLFAFAAAVLAGLGADHLEKDRRLDAWMPGFVARLRWITLALLTGLVLLNGFLYIYGPQVRSWGRTLVASKLATSGAAYIYNRAWQLGKVDVLIDNYSLLSPTMYKFFLLAGASMLLLLWFSRGRLDVNVLKALCLALVTLDLLFVGWSWMPSVDRSMLYPPTRATSFLRSHAAPYRVDSVWDKQRDPPVLRPNEMLPYGVASPNAYESLVPDDRLQRAEFWDLLGVKYVAAPPGRTPGRAGFTKVYDKEIAIFENRRVMPRAFLLSRWEVLPDSDSVLARMYRQPERVRDTVFLEQSPAPRAGSVQSPVPAPVRPARIRRYTPSEVAIDVRSNIPGILVFTDRVYPGWTAQVDGKEAKLLRAYSALRGVYVPAGSHSVSFRFMPRSLLVGAATSAAAIAIAVGLAMTKKGVGSFEPSGLRV